MKNVMVGLFVVLMPFMSVMGGGASIKSALGMVLGAKCKTKDKKTEAQEDGTELYPFTPPKKVDPFDKYLIEVTPKTRIISQIWATATFNQKKDAKAALDKIAGALEKRYGERENSGRLAEIAAQLDGFVIEKGMRYIMVTIAFERNKQRLFLKYVDKDLKFKAKQERRQIEKEGLDKPKLGGAL